MLDVIELDKGLKLKSIARLFDTEHPFQKLIRNKTDLSDFFFPKSLHNVDELSIEGIKLLKSIRYNLTLDPSLFSNRKLVMVIQNIKITNGF